MASRIDIEGIAELQREFMLAAVKTRAAAADAVADEVTAIRDDAKATAPRDKGELADGIVGRASGTTGEVRTTARHSSFVEHGTYKDRAQPYMAPAAERSRKRFVGRVGGTIKVALGRRG